MDCNVKIGNDEADEIGKLLGLEWERLMVTEMTMRDRQGWCRIYLS